PAVHVVRDVQRAVRPDRDSRRPVRSLTRFLHRAGEAVSEDLVVAGGLAAGEGLKHHVVAALRERRPVPRSVECDERTLAIAGRELTAVIENEVVGRPVRGEDREGAALLRTRPDGLPAVAAVLRGENQLALGLVEEIGRASCRE